MKILTSILAGSAPVIALVMALQLDARDRQIAALILAVSYTHLTLPTNREV